MRNISILLIALAFVLIGCKNAADPEPNNDVNYEAKYDSLKDLDAKAAIALGNEWRTSAPKITTHVTTEEVIFKFPDGREVKKPLPEDAIYVAIAPYINTTHECEQHYLSSCDAELKEKSFKVTASMPNGPAFIDKTYKSLKNGFFEIWLPRNGSFTVKIEYGSLKGEETLATTPGSRTCITTIQLK